MFRRTLFCLLGVILLCPSVLRLSRADEEPGAKVSPREALKRLQEGNERFVADKPTAHPPYSEQRKELAKGQKPFAVILTCSDSRVAPELIFNQQLGDLFVIRVAGNVTDPIVLGSIEYAVEHLHAPLIVVVGHSNCGAVQAALETQKPKGNVGELIKQVRVGSDLPKGKAAAVAAGVKANVLYQARQLTAKSEVLRDFVTSGRVQIATGIYSLETGRVEWLQPAAKGK
jgi:carbonic anhydrase